MQYQFNNEEYPGAFAAMKEWILASLYGSGTNTPFDITPIGAIWFLLASFWGSIFLKISFRMKAWQRVLFILALFAVGYFTAQLFFLPFSIQPGMCSALFMYLGYSARMMKSVWDKTDVEVKIASFIFSA